MRLINTQTHELTELFHNIPPYAILSHTWGNEEVTFQEYLLATGSEANRYAHIRRKAGFSKIMGACHRARSDGLKFLWCDTNCIDKSSSAELTEAINSMYAWYRDSVICYAFLADVDLSPKAFAKSRWFTRGWTLQELLAPKKLVFFDGRWGFLGDRKDLAGIISKVTRIHIGALEDRNTVPKYSIAQRMSWVADRITSRLEDIAYCLLGIFDVNMPLLYGEGRKAFIRLQEEIIRISDDQSILAWSSPGHPCHLWKGALAQSPSYFLNCGSIIMNKSLNKYTYSPTNLGISIRAPLIKTSDEGIVFIGLNSVFGLRRKERHTSANEFNVPRQFQVWVRLRQVGRNRYERCDVPGSRIALGHLYPLTQDPKVSDIFLVHYQETNIHPHHSHIPIAVHAAELERPPSGILISFSSGKLDPHTGNLIAAYPLPDFCSVSLQPRGYSTISHELILTKSYMTILSVSWDDEGVPEQCTHTTIQASGIQTVQLMRRQHEWDQLFGRQTSFEADDRKTFLSTMHNKLRSVYGYATSSEMNSPSPSVSISKQQLTNLRGQAEVVVSIVFREPPELGD